MRRLGARSRGPGYPPKRDDADRVPSLFDSPPAAQPAGGKRRSWGGAAPPVSAPDSQAGPSQYHPAPPSPLQGCLIPVLLPHPSHEEVPSAGELEAIDKAHLRNGRDSEEGHEDRPPSTPGASVKGVASPGLGSVPALPPATWASPLPLKASAPTWPRWGRGAPAS